MRLCQAEGSSPETAALQNPPLFAISKAPLP
jgi:hypothetical protein